MAVEDSWHLRKWRSETESPPRCEHSDLIPSARHGRGLRYRVRWPDAETKSFRTKGEANRYLLSVQTAPKVPAVPQILVGELVERWLATKKGLAPRGYEACVNAAMHVRERWGTTLADSVRKHEVEAWLAGMDASGSLKGKLYQCLSGAYKTFPAIESPCQDIRVGKDQAHEARFLSVEELQSVASAAGHNRPMVLFLGTTGVRISECIALNVGDIDVQRRRARVRTSKNGEARDVPVPASVLAMLDLERDRDAPLFLTERGRRVSKDHWRAARFTPACRSVGIVMRIHDLRHTAASLAIAAGANVKVVQRMLGHKTAKMTLDLYGHLWDKSLDEVADRMDAALTAPAQKRPVRQRRPRLRRVS